MSSLWKKDKSTYSLSGKNDSSEETINLFFYDKHYSTVKNFPTICRRACIASDASRAIIILIALKHIKQYKELNKMEKRDYCTKEITFTKFSSYSKQRA
jgi:hypothetical protein